MTKKPANENHLLKTKIKDLTPEQLAELTKPVGTADVPVPMWGTQRTIIDGQSELQQILSTIASNENPLVIYSERPYEEVVALTFCDMPVPSMLPIWADGLERRRPESTLRAQMMISDPGFGKSFLGAHQIRLRTNEAPFIFDCGGKSMNELLFEMVLDFGKTDALPTAIDKRLQNGTLEPLSIAALKNLPGSVKDEEGNDQSIVSLDAEGNITSIDWNYFRGNGAQETEVEAAFKILKEVSEIEGLDKAGGNALGMNSQYGPLVRAFMEGREIVLDEYNKSKEGSDNALQTVLQFLIGEIPTCTVENTLKNKDTSAGPASFTFRREDTKLGFFVTLTGNKTEDGSTTRSLNQSVYSRLSPDTLPDPQVIDWQHRICQMMVGMPVSTLYMAYQEQADADPKAFGEWLMELRQAKARVNGVPVPEIEETLLQNWQNVVHASEKLAKFYSQWADMTNAEKIFSGGHTELVEEVDEQYSKQEAVDFRKIQQHLQKAFIVRPQMLAAEETAKVNFTNFFKKPELEQKEPENPSLFFGTRLVDLLDRIVYEKSAAVGKMKLYEALKEAMNDAGLRDIVLTGGGAHSAQKSVEEDLNISPFDGNDIRKQAELARKVFCDYLREVDKEIVETNDDSIITLDRFRKSLKAAEENKAAETHELHVVNRDYETLTTSPIATARIEDAATFPINENNPDEPIDPGFTMADIVTHDDFMASLALPVISGKNLEAIWDGHIRQRMIEDAVANGEAPPSDADEALDIAENVSARGIATTSLRVAFEDAATGEVRDVSVHVVVNTARNKTLVVSEKLPSKLAAAFKEAGITHVDRNADNAEAKVDAALAELTRGMPDAVRDRVADAFKYRNAVDADDSRSLAQLMVSNDVDMMYGKYVVKNKKLVL